ncbi:MAG: Tripartite tricarboxylate transporter TctC family [Firmicutes bacterium]|nr:Tripartite tricarboxylate transporter TctC family [Bacillota bacterium]MDI6705633.1 tripartite tricarboxylate transporter substrate binding protein [Bacillota bacterium]
MKKTIMVLLIVSLFILAVGCSKENQAPEQPKTTFPERPLEFVACYAPGGGHDVMLRTMAKILADEGIVDTAINVVNKPGGSGAVGMGYVNGHAGDGHYLMATTSSFITTPLNSDIGINYKDFTPIARLGIDPELVLVNSKSGYQTLDDILKSDKPINVGGTGQGTIEHLVTVRLSKLSGKKLNFIPYQGDGEVIAALMGNQIDMTITNPNTAYDYIKSGDFRALAISTTERIDLMADVPTFRELGYDITLSLFRGVAAPKDIPEEAKAYYVDIIKKMVETETWKKDYLEKNMITPGYLEGEEYAKYLDEMNQIYEETLRELGIIK